METNDEIAIKLYKKAAEQGLMSAKYNLGHCYEYGEYIPKNISGNTHSSTSNIEPGHDTSRIMERRYLYGNRIERDYSEAFKRYQRAANCGHMYSIYKLGDFLREGKGVEKDTKAAFKRYLIVAEKGYAYAQYTIGVCYQGGIGVDKNYESAVDWFLKASEQGNVDAQCRLGSCYLYGYGVNADKATAIALYQKVADQDYTPAKLELKSLKPI